MTRSTNIEHNQDQLNNSNNNSNNKNDNNDNLGARSPTVDNNNDNLLMMFSPGINNNNTNNKPKKQFTPNIRKHVFKNNNSASAAAAAAEDNNKTSLFDIVSPTNNYLNKSNNITNNNNNNNNNNTINGLHREEIDVEEMEQQIESILKANQEHRPTIIPPKPMFLKIKRKIDEEPLEEIIIERPKKRALLDTFQSFNLNSNQEEDDENDNNNNNNNNTESSPEPNITNNNNNNAITNNNNNQQQDKEKKLFKLFTSVDEANLHHNRSKIEQRFIEFQSKGHVDSPKIQRTKRENVIKERNEIRYKQIRSNRIIFDQQQTSVIELERTEVEKDELFPTGLTKEEESLICNYRPMLKEHLHHNNNNDQQPNTQQLQKQQIQEDSMVIEKKQTKKIGYVYDYYYLNSDQVGENLKHIETIQLPAEDDYFTANDDDQSDSSTDSENWYTEYPDGDEVYSDKEVDSDDPYQESDDMLSEKISDYDGDYMYEQEYSSDDDEDYY
ncbi:hypothetical protein DFA_07567 [Cavenderia fasciculata]|uniref:RNA polymerase II nuclear localization protein SLC7A6OS n=1 Tax=Cavenderia fasciculata TaxID=261658 RepID=F4PWS9_CACFS|nr:uncharacterized protein DFA_07567 [Cavenderia fasciculata]EGG20443.1 hypothetical protein DFA_07567 [Cavenderia fasciculata]|eukprot:XP_004367426.1 hypothetical protein DFA_07567 [Cavenderia fasciculata]